MRQLMRTLVTWLMILALAFQWMAGHLYFRVAYSIETEHRMDEREARLAAQLKEKMGFELRLRKLDKAEFDPRFIGYGNQFFFLEEEEGLFSITPDTSYTCEYTYLLGHGPEDGPQKQALLERLFSKFTVSKVPMALKRQAVRPLSPNFITPRLHDLFAAEVLTPPPREKA